MAKYCFFALLAILPALIAGQTQGPVIEPTVTDVYVAEGDSQKLRCSYVKTVSGPSDNLKTLKLEWEPSAQNSNYKENAMQEMKDGKLTLILEIEIEQFTPNHDGRWNCILKNLTSNSEDKNYINLSLIDVDKKGDTFKYGDDTVSVNCGINPRQTGRYFYLQKWMKDGEDLDTSSGSVYQRDSDSGNLTIKPATREHAGEYVAVYEIGADQTCNPCVPYECKVAVQADPFVKDFDKSKNLIEDENMKLQCGVLGYPKPKVSWFKDDVNLMNNNDPESRIKFKESNGFQNAELNIKAVEFDDAGDYKCVAVSPTNSSIKTEKSIVVRVKDKYAALWPFLGIVGEVIVLCTIIFIYERRRSKQAQTSEANTHEADPAEKKGNVRNRRHQK